jgi:glycosyltransferase involved in cell wall biosynthesis
VDRLIEEVKEDSQTVDVVIADGTGPWCWQGVKASVSALPFVSQDIFLAELGKSHVSYLPLQERNRAAGHMVFVAGLEAGVPTVISRTSGTAEYVTRDSNVVDGYPGLNALMQIASADEEARARLRLEWKEKFSQEAYILRATTALASLGWPKGEL